MNASDFFGVLTASVMLALDSIHGVKLTTPEWFLCRPTKRLSPNCSRKPCMGGPKALNALQTDWCQTHAGIDRLLIFVSKKWKIKTGVIHIPHLITKLLPSSRAVL